MIPYEHTKGRSILTRGGSRIGTVELQHPLLPLDIIDDESFFFNSFFILLQYIILKLNVSSHPQVYENSRAATPLILATSRH
jgi:hypothetical protein